MHALRRLTRCALATAITALLLCQAQETTTTIPLTGGPTITPQPDVPISTIPPPNPYAPPVPAVGSPAQLPLPAPAPQPQPHVNAPEPAANPTPRSRP